nr:MAG TPA: hypothetical protein [Caudoviricetes sp.]
MGMPTTSLILFAVATVASSGDCSILRSGEKNLVDGNADDLTDSFRGGDGSVFGRLLDFAVCIARNSELFCHFTLCETGVLAGLFNGESQVHTSFRLGSRILYSTFSRMSRT